MGNLDYKAFGRRHRPHLHPPGATLFLTYRLAGSVPLSIVREYKAKKEGFENELWRLREKGKATESRERKEWLERTLQFQREWFVRYEDALHRASQGPMWMKNKKVAEKVAESLRRLDGRSYQLDAYCVMSNHVHAVITPSLSLKELVESFDEGGHLLFISKHPGLSKIMHFVKGWSARECNLILARSGQFWEHESFDHVVRSGKLPATIRYVLYNPVKAGLVRDWREWSWSYCRRELLADLLKSDKL